MVRTLSKLYGLQCQTPTTDGGLGLTVRGLAKKLGKNKRRMFPITKPLLKRLIHPDCDILDLEGSEGLAKDNPEGFQQLFGPTILHHVYSALFLLSFLSFLRVGNVIPQTRSKFDKLRQLVWRRVVYKLPTDVILKIISAKNIQDFSRTLEVPISAMPGSVFCGISALQKLLNIPTYPRGKNQPVFNVPDMKGGWVQGQGCFGSED